MNLINVNGETILPITLYGGNRAARMVEFHSEVMEKFLGLSMNYLVAPFPGVSHGLAAQHVINQTIDSVRPDYFLLLDFDNIFLNKSVVNQMYDSVRYKNSIWGCATQSNHVKGPGNFFAHPYASQACLCFSRKIYDELGRPDLDHWSDDPPKNEFGGDTCERLTYEAEKAGFSVSLLYPSSSILKNSNLGNGLSFGRGNFYGPNLVFHQMQNDFEGSEEEFISVCKRTLAGEFK